MKQLSWPVLEQRLPGFESSILKPAPGNEFKYTGERVSPWRVEWKNISEGQSEGY